MALLTNILQALVVTLREGTEAALVVGIVLAYLRKTGREDLNRSAYLGLGLAVAASVLGAGLFYRYGLDPENELLEGITMLVAALLVSSFVLWMWRAGRQLKGKIEKKLESLVTVSRPALFSGLGILIFVFLMVLREGVETVLFLGALSVSVGANPVYNFLGGALGLALAGLFGIFLVKGSFRVKLGSFFTVTGVVLLLLALKLFAGAVHEFSEIGLLPTSPTELAIVGFLTRESTSLLILMALILIPGFLLWWYSLKQEEPSEGLSPAEKRKALAALRRNQRWATAALGVALAMSLLLASFLVASAGRGHDPKPIALEPRAGEVRVALSGLEMGRMYKYSTNLNGKTIRFFLIRQPGSLIAAYDVCNICPAKGYYQSGEEVICRNCDAPINIATIGQPGGCNPVPLNFRQEGQEMVVSLKELSRLQARF